MATKLKNCDDFARQLNEDAALLVKYEGRSIRAYVKKRGVNVYVANPLIAKLEAAQARLQAAKNLKLPGYRRVG